jgi:hypothetical protein
MMNDLAVRALSNDELDAISGGKDKLVVCVRDQKVSLLGVTFNWASCENGEKIFYVTTD